VKRSVVVALLLATPATAQDKPSTITEPTPMNERVVRFAVLNKQNGRVQEFTAKPGQVVAAGPLTVRIRACEATPAWDRPWSGAFLQVDERPRRGGQRRVFSGWLFAESPSLNSMQHPNYDVWVKSCTMSFPEMGPQTVVAGRSTGASSERAPSKRSSAAKSASTESAEAN
jgi:hypothetical protein